MTNRIYKPRAPILEPMEGLTIGPGRTEMEKPYLCAQGVDYFGHAVFQRAGLPLTMHHHNQCMELVYVISGTQSYYTQNHEYSLVGGQAFVSFPFQPHRSGEDVQDVSEIYWIQLNLSDQESFLGYCREFSLYITDRLLEMDLHVFPFDAACGAAVKSCFQRFLRDGASPEALSCLMHLIVLTLDCYKNHRTPQNPLEQLEKYIDEHISEPIRIEDLSRVSGYSVSTISHRFRQYYGRSPGEYVNYRKISKAKKLLATGKSVTQAAMELGFGSSDYFSTVFKKFSGQSPAAWREEHQAGIT